MSYQSEERYWTDYLRIALPVVGLLLMLGLFWFWATSLIGDENDDDPADLAAIPTATVPVTAPSPSPTPVTDAAGQGTEPVIGAGTEAASGDGAETDPEVTDGTDEGAAADDTTDGAATDDGGSGATDEEAPADDGADNTACDAELCPDQLVITTTDVNLRSDPTTEEENVVTVVPANTELTVIGESTEGDDGNTWVEVEFDEENETGFVATSNLELSE